MENTMFFRCGAAGAGRINDARKLKTMQTPSPTHTLTFQKEECAVRMCVPRAYITPANTLSLRDGCMWNDEVGVKYKARDATSELNTVCSASLVVLSFYSQRFINHRHKLLPCSWSLIWSWVCMHLMYRRCREKAQKDLQKNWDKRIDGKDWKEMREEVFLVSSEISQRPNWNTKFSACGLVVEFATLK